MPADPPHTLECTLIARVAALWVVLVGCTARPTEPGARPGGTSGDSGGPPATGQSYAGPLIDSHVHIATYREGEDEAPTFRVDARAEGQRREPYRSELYVEALDRNGIACVVAFHSIAPSDGDDANSALLLDHATRLTDAHPGRFQLFAEVFRQNPIDWYRPETFEPALALPAFSGLGEIQMANTPFSDGNEGDRTVEIFPDDPRLLALYEMLGDLGRPVMAHPGTLEGLDAAISADPRVVWLIHGWQIHDEWNDMAVLDAVFTAHENVFYTIDFAESLPEHLEIMKRRRGAEDPGPFLDHMTQHAAEDVARMEEVWNPLVTRWPDRFLWGTDMARPGWQWTEPEVLDLITAHTRAWLGTLPPDVAEAVAWRNAHRVLAPCDPG